jgi:hypothetical protein
MRAIAARDEETQITVGPEWPALQIWLSHGERRVVVPFMPAVAELASRNAIRMRRDFSVIKSMIEAHALLHRATRERDAEGAIVATLADYAVVRDLIAELISDGHAMTVKPQVRETVEAVRVLTASGGGTSVRAVAARLELDESSTSRRCSEAARSGFIVNQEIRGKKARYVIADPMPEDATVLPTRAELEAALSQEDVMREFAAAG